MAELLRRHQDETRNWQVKVVTHDIETAFELLRTTALDVALIGLDHERFDGVELTERLLRSGVRTKILLSVPKANAYLARCAARLRVPGLFEETNASLHEIQAAIVTLLGGHRYRPSEQPPITRSARSTPPFHCLLTDRQETILRWIAHFKTDTEIARAFAISPCTAKRHRADLLRKLSVHDTVRLIDVARHLGFASRPLTPVLSAHDGSSCATHVPISTPCQLDHAIRPAPNDEWSRTV